MKLNLKYKDIIKNSKRGNEKTMWNEVDRVDCLVAKLREENPQMARDFLKGSYEDMNGKHINEWLAKEMVANMWHNDPKGNAIQGEQVSQAEAARLLLDGMDAEKKEKMQWDAYVAANAFAHDLANTGHSMSEIMVIAKHFWFHDDDMGDNCHKVYWFFEDWIFG